MIPKAADHSSLNPDYDRYRSFCGPSISGPPTPKVIGIDHFGRLSTFFATGELIAADQLALT